MFVEMEYFVKEGSGQNAHFVVECKNKEVDYMKRPTIDENKRCPKCGKIENQIKVGFNRSGTQRCQCKECGTRYTLNPKKKEYSEEERNHALKLYYSGVSARGVGKIMGMSKANVLNWIKKTK